MQLRLFYFQRLRSKPSVEFRLQRTSLRVVLFTFTLAYGIFKRVIQEKLCYAHRKDYIIRNQ